MKIEFDLKERKNEIIVILSYLAIFFTLIFFINYLKTEEESKKFDEELARIQYNSLKNSNLSKSDLTNELAAIEQEIESVKQKLPVNLKHQDVNEMLSEISTNTGGIFNLGNCDIADSKTTNNSITYEVKIKNIKASYAQIENLLNYIKEYKSKIGITQLELIREDMNVSGNLTIVFYSEKQGGDEL